MEVSGIGATPPAPGTRQQAPEPAPTDNSQEPAPQAAPPPPPDDSGRGQSVNTSA